MPIMPEITPDALYRAISEANKGLGIDQIVTRFGEHGSRRTLQRKLDELVKAGRIERLGNARATKYHAPASPPHVPPERVGIQYEKPRRVTSVVREDAPEPDSPLRELRDYFREHYSLRKPVGYRREFLDAYIPNETMYLPEDTLEHLRSHGQSPEMAELPPGTYARQVLDRLIIDLSWNSSRLEGNTFSLLETDFLLQQGRSEDPLRHEEAQMILNHKAAIEFIVEEPDQQGFNRYTFLNLHAVLTEELMKNRKDEGVLRVQPVGIGGSVFHPTNNPALIEECFDLILQKAAAIRDPLECSFFLMVHMPYLQPFMDGNKRMSRLSANIPLVQANMSPLSFTGVSVPDYTTAILAVYELNRVELLREVFAHAYVESAHRYGAIRGQIGDPDRVAVGYRMEIKELVREVVVKRLGKLEAAQHVRHWAAKNITASDRAHFIEIIEERLLALSMNSIVRVRVRPSEFEAWWPIWSNQKPK
jgi:fido (protein-threonine AMPylation protein)